MRRDWRMCGLRATLWLACFYPPRSPRVNGGGGGGGGKMRRDWRMCWLRATLWLACFYPLGPPCQRGEAKCGETGVCVGCGRLTESPLRIGVLPGVSQEASLPPCLWGDRGGWRAAHKVAPTDRDNAVILARGQPPPMPMGDRGGLAGDSQSRPYGSGFCREFRKKPASPHDDGGTEGGCGILPGVTAPALGHQADPAEKRAGQTDLAAAASAAAR